MVEVAETKERRPTPEGSMGYYIEKVKSAAQAANPALDPEGLATALQFNNLSSKMGQMLKATEKLIEL